MNISPKAQESLNRVVTRMQQGDLAPIVQLASIRHKPNVNLPAAGWSFANQISVLMQTDQFDNRGYRQWQEAGRQVKSGASAAYILGPKQRKVHDEKSGDDITVLTGFVTIPVFPLSATEGPPLPDLLENLPTVMPPLYDEALRLGISVEHCPLTSHMGMYSPRKDAIRLATPDESVFFHELAHAIQKRLRQQSSYDEDEVSAELTACVLMNFYGLRDHTGNAWQYIQKYADNPITAVFKAMTDVGNVLAYLGL